MGRPQTSNGNIFYRKDRKRWVTKYFIKDYNTGKLVEKRKIFQTEQEAKDFLKTLEYQKEDPIFIKKNGIPLAEILKLNLNKKKEMNLISESQYNRVLMSIKKIEKSYIAQKNIDDITTDDIQGFLNSQVEFSDSTIKKLKEQIGQAF